MRVALHRHSYFFFLEARKHVFFAIKSCEVWKAASYYYYYYYYYYHYYYYYYYH